MPEREMSAHAKAIYARTFGPEARRRWEAERKQKEEDAEAVAVLYLQLKPWRHQEQFQEDVERGWQELPHLPMSDVMRLGKDTEHGWPEFMQRQTALRHYRQLIDRLISEGLLQPFELYEPGSDNTPLDIPPVSKVSGGWIHERKITGRYFETGKANDSGDPE